MNPTFVATTPATDIESPYAWARLFACLVLSTIGGVALWSTAVVLPTIQTQFAVDRAAAALPYTAAMLGFVVGGPAMGWLSDRFGIALPAAIGATLLGAGFLLTSQATDISQFALAHGLLIGVGGSASFGPVIADISLWFSRRRGIAVAICSSGSYLAGTIWPLVIQPLVASVGWRQTYLGIGVFCLGTMLPLILALRRRRHGAGVAPGEPRATGRPVLPRKLTPN